MTAPAGVAMKPQIPQGNHCRMHRLETREADSNVSCECVACPKIKGVFLFFFKSSFFKISAPPVAISAEIESQLGYLIWTVRNNGSYIGSFIGSLSPSTPASSRVKNSCGGCWGINSNPVQGRYAAGLVMCWLSTTIYVLCSGRGFCLPTEYLFQTRCIEALFSG